MQKKPEKPTPPKQITFDDMYGGYSDSINFGFLSLGGGILTVVVVIFLLIDGMSISLSDILLVLIGGLFIFLGIVLLGNFSKVPHGKKRKEAELKLQRDYEVKLQTYERDLEYYNRELERFEETCKKYDQEYGLRVTQASRENTKRKNEAKELYDNARMAIQTRWK